MRERPITQTIGTSYEHDDRRNVDVPLSELLVSSVYVNNTDGPHEKVTIFTRGANAGLLIVESGDGREIAQRLLASNMRLVNAVAAHDSLDVGASAQILADAQNMILSEALLYARGCQVKPEKSPA